MLAPQNYNNIFNNQTLQSLKPQMQHQQCKMQQGTLCMQQLQQHSQQQQQQQQQKKQFKKQAAPAVPANNSNPNGNNSQTSIREGDWICSVCNNLNFSFRKECNRCQAIKTDNTSTCVSKNSNLFFMNPVSGLPTGTPIQQQQQAPSVPLGLGALPQPMSLNFLMDFSSNIGNNTNNFADNSVGMVCAKPPGLRNPLQDISSSANSAVHPKGVAGNLVKPKNLKLAQSFGLTSGYFQDDLLADSSSLPERPRRLSQEDTALPSPVDYFGQLDCFSENRGFTYTVLVTPTRDRDSKEEDDDFSNEEEYCGSHAASTYGRRQNLSPSTLPSLGPLLRSLAA